MNLNISILLLFINFNFVISNEFGNRVIYGKRAHKGQFPWYVNLWVKYARRSSYFQHCGGTLISSEWVITATHCLKDCFYVELHLGSITFGKPSLKMNSNHFEIYPTNLSSNILDFDIGLVKLPGTFGKFSESISPAILPKRSMTSDFLRDKICVVSGFGRYSKTGNKPNDRQTPDLLFGKVRILLSDECNSGFYKDQFYTVMEHELCAKETNENICMGDSGGGVIFQEDNKAYLVGIVEFGAATCDSLPSVLTSVNPFLDWISEITGIEIYD